jgi:hypothetical protein
MKNTVLFALGCLTVGFSLPAQEIPRELRGGGHRLGETAEQFYSAEYAGDILSACAAHNWKSVTRLFQYIEPASKLNAKDICAAAAAIKQRALAGARIEYKGTGDTETQRRDTFTFDHGHLVKIEMVYSGSTANVEGIHPKSYADLLSGLQQAYGDPSNTNAGNPGHLWRAVRIAPRHMARQRKCNPDYRTPGHQRVHTNRSRNDWRV